MKRYSNQLIQALKIVLHGSRNLQVALTQAKGTVEKLETGKGVILSEAKNLNTAQADSSVATLPQNDRGGFSTHPKAQLSQM